jgi:hypothetical protein
VNPANLNAYAGYTLKLAGYALRLVGLTFRISDLNYILVNNKELTWYLTK